MLEKPDIPYKSWIVELKQKIQQSQIKAAMRVNSALIELYWELGKEISEKEFENSYGSGFFDQLSKDLKKEFPNIKGFSATNLKYTKRFYLFYNQSITIREQVTDELKKKEIGNLQQLGGELENTNRHQLGNEFENKINTNRQQVVDNSFQKIFLIPWRHQVEIITKCKTTKEAFFYINKTIENGWSRAVLMNMMSAKLIESQGKAVTNFAKTLPDYDSDLVRETLKDPYNFDFLTLSETFKEKELEDALIDNIQKFLIELGSGFAFVGRQFEIIVSNKPHRIDLLFYHIKLKRYIVIDLKAKSFEPEFVGKLNFYVTAVDRQMRDEIDNATIGLLICKEKDEIIAEYSLADMQKPLGVSSYELQNIYQKIFNPHYQALRKLKRNYEIFRFLNQTNSNDFKQIQTQLFYEKTTIRYQRSLKNLH